CSMLRSCWFSAFFPYTTLCRSSSQLSLIDYGWSTGLVNVDLTAFRRVYDKLTIEKYTYNLFILPINFFRKGSQSLLFTLKLIRESKGDFFALNNIDLALDQFLLHCYY